MSVAIEKSQLFHTDITGQFRWYFNQAGEPLAWQFFNAIDLTLLKLAKQPDLGTIRHFQNPPLQGLRSFRVERPFHKFLIFYKTTETSLLAWRLMHGARDLPRRLTEPSGT